MTMIFETVRPLEDVVAAADKARNDPNNKLAAVTAEGRIYRDIYAETIKMLQKADMISVEEAADILSITPNAYRARAAKGKALLISIEGHEFVPAWSLNFKRVDPLVLDMAREFVREGQSFFKFNDMIDFMENSRADISRILPKQSVKDFFNIVGLSKYRCSVSVLATMAQLTSDRAIHPEFAPILFERLDKALTHGGWDAMGGMSRAFRDKYKIPGLTLEEAYQKANRPPGSNPSP